jgi:hypothetical protein
MAGIPSSIDIQDCWSGTGESSATLRIRVKRKTYQDPASGSKTVYPVGHLTSVPMPKQIPIVQERPWCPA